MSLELLGILAAAIGGGVILNVMPCVLPVLTLKIHHIIAQAEGDSLDDAGRRAHWAASRREALYYTVGVLLVFIALATLALVFKLKWGQQFQQPHFTAGLAILMVVMGLNALGVFEITVGMSGAGHSGALGAIFNGVVAAIMSTPCSAPGVSLAVPYALADTTPGWQTFVVFSAIGLGLALPFVLVAWFPRLAKVLPRPGAWMETFKHLMGFTLLAAALWIFGTLMHQVSADSAFWFLGFLLLVAVGLWAVGRFAGLHHEPAQRWLVRLVVLVAVGSAGWARGMRFEARAATVDGATTSATHSAVKDGRINWMAFTPDRVEVHRRRKQPVFVDYTAEWCANCKANERLVLETDRVRSALVSTGVLPMKADWTNEDELIGSWLETLGRSEIPAYAIYFPDGSHDLLPVVITPDMVVARLEAAAARYPESGFLSLEDACLAGSDPVVASP